MTERITTLAATGVLTLAVSVFFYLQSLPLDANDTLVVAACCLILAVSLRAVWKQIHREKNR